MDPIRTVVNWLRDVLGTRLFTLGDTPITTWTFVYIILLAVILYFLSGRLRTWVADSFLARRGVEIGVRLAVGSLLRYVVLVLGFLAILQSTGINLSTLIFVGGAVGIGVGLGLQRVANDFVSGLILLIERPVKVGDRVEVTNVVGDVTKIGMRATTIVTNDNIAIIVPNSEFTSTAVTNWSFTGQDVRIHLPVGVSYNSEPELVRSLLLDVASKHEGVLKDPRPDVTFMGFGESSLDFELRVWTRSYITRPFVLRSDLYFAVWKVLKANGIEIPFPQRDIHIRNGVGLRAHQPEGPDEDGDHPSL